MSSIAATISSKIQTLLAAIDGTGSYQTDIGGRAYREFEAPQAVAEATFPYVTFGAVRYSEEPWDLNNTVKKVSADYAIRVYADWSDSDPEGAILDLYSDVKVALEADPTLAGLAMDSRVSECEIGEIKEEFRHVTAVVGFRVEFTHAATDPTS